MLRWIPTQVILVRTSSCHVQNHSQGISCTSAHSVSQLCFWVVLSIKRRPGLVKAISQNSGQIPRVGKSIQMLPPAAIFGCDALKVFSREPWKLSSEGCIDSSSKLTPRSGFQCARLTLLQSQSTTGNGFEERQASKCPISQSKRWPESHADRWADLR